MTKPASITEQQDDLLEATYDKEKSVLVNVWQALRERLVDTGLEEALNVLPRPEQAAYKLSIDPFDKSQTLIGTWLDNHGSQIGEIQIRDNGSIYAEMDVIRNHPTDGRWFVESVTAWGDRENIKTELSLLPAI